MMFKPMIQSEDMYLKNIRIEHENARYKNAADLAIEATEIYPDNWDFVYLYVNAMLDVVFKRPNMALLDQMEAICDYLITACEGKLENLTSPLPEKSFAPYELRACVAFVKGDYVEAEARFLDGIALYPDCPNLLSGYGWTLCKLQRHDEAEKYFRAGLEANEAHVDSTLGYGELLLFCEGAGGPCPGHF